MHGMRISQLAKASGLPPSTLRFYEAEGLLRAERTAAGYRSYGPQAVQRLGFIGAAKHLGLPLGEIAQLLEVWESGACAQVKAELRPRLAARLHEAERRRTQLAAFADTLRGAITHLDALPERSERCDPGCRRIAQPTDRLPGRGAGLMAGAGRAPGAVDVELSARPHQPQRWHAAPVACTLAPGQLGERARRWHEATEGAVRARIEDGVRLTLPVARVVELAALAVAEQECCAFFDFRLHLDGPSVHLEVRAPAEAGGLLDRLFAGDRAL